MIVSSINGVWKISTHRRMKLDLYLIPYFKINSKLTEDLNIRTETIKLLEDNKDKHPLDIDFFGQDPKTQTMKAKIDKRTAPN